MIARALLLPGLLLVAAATVRAQKKPEKIAPPDPQEVADLQALTTWLADYRTGAQRLTKDGRTDDEAVQRLGAMLAAVAKWNHLNAAKLLLQAAAVDPQLAGTTTSTESIEFYRELQPWTVQALAVEQLRGMTGDGILQFLIARLGAAGVRSNKKNQEQLDAAAVLRVLGGHKSVEAKLELLKACRSMPTELRVQAVNSMAKDANLELLPTMIELLRDTEPNVRIAACNAIGVALQPHVDETLGKEAVPETLALRDQSLAKLEEILLREPIWQVRAAAAFAMAVMRCKAAIPSLIRGLDAELQRKKDPWAMDVRLHRLLEGLTGQNVVRGTITPWKEFWAREGDSFTVRRKDAEKPQQDNRYQRFFNLEVESDRVLFVVDFSGSMEEDIQLQSGQTGAPAGQKTTKAQLVVSELKKLVMSLPDGAMLNMIVFSDEVRIWRQEGGHPALVKVDDAARDDLLGRFLDSLRPSGPTNLHGALSKALDFAGRSLHDKAYSAGFDTIYVITDGAPSAGAVTDKEEIRRLVREANQLRQLTIHCITFGAKNDTSFLKPMAEENGGRHIHVE
jgi:hypothetical protein